METGSQLTEAEQVMYEDVILDRFFKNINKFIINRDNDINKLVEMVNDLATVFKSLN